MSPYAQDHFSDSDDDFPSNEETSVLLGVPDGFIDALTDINDAAVSRIGGHPAFLPSREPSFSSSHCRICSSPMELLVQMWCPFENSPMDRVLYIWGCSRVGCQRKEGSVRAWRGLRYNEQYAAELKKKFRRKQEKKAKTTVLLGAEKQTEAAKINPFSIGNPSDMSNNRLGVQVFGDRPIDIPRVSDASVINHGDEGNPSDDESDTSEELILTAIASTSIPDSPWRLAPSYSPIYLSTLTECLPPFPKARLPPGALYESGGGKAGKDADFSWSSEKYEKSLGIDQVFERFTRRVAAEGEQCVRYELNGIPLPFTSDQVFRNLFLLPSAEALPVTKPDFKVVQSPSRGYDPSTVPPCPLCQSKRVFECQLMPNLINVVTKSGEREKKKLTDEERRQAVERLLKGGKAEENGGMEWGTCFVFSCEKDCCIGEREGFFEEMVLVFIFPKLIPWVMSHQLANCPSNHAPGAGYQSASETSAKFPHTRAQLVAIARQYKPLDNGESCVDGEDSKCVPHYILQRVIAMLADENEDDLKVLLKETFSMDDDMLEQNVLDLMHKHRDDVAGVPFLFLTPTRRPISRPSSRASTGSSRLYPVRPDTPASAPASPLALVFRRPHTPVASPLAAAATQASSYMTAKSDYSASPHSSPVLAHAQATQAHAQFTASLPASPLSSPRLLNARASEFRPIQRPLSAASSNPGSLLRADTPSPDLWAHNSPRTSSNLAIAAPLIADKPSNSPNSVTPASSLRSSLLPGDEEDEDDPFNPFSTKPFPLSFHSLSISDYDTVWEDSDQSRSPEGQTPAVNQPAWQMSYGYYPSDPNGYGLFPPDILDDSEANAVLTDGMTPFDVLSSVFGSTLAPSELEEALANNGYDFDRAMAWLVDKALPTAPQAAPIRMQSMGSRVMLVSRDPQIPFRGGRGAYPTLASVNGRPGQRHINNGRLAQAPTRVCRYYLAGECLRADCRFSHELERALCRFWLRGTCAKQESCEFMHRLPKDADLASVNAIIARANVPPGSGPLAAHTAHNPPPEDFPALGYDNSNGKARRVHEKNDPSRTRFAAAVKKAALVSPPQSEATAAVRREVMGLSADNLHSQSAIVAPRPSPRLKLRPPSLLPTLPTGEVVNKLYMAYRQRALQLGAARNACLSRAADAWRRGDGAAAKRFSREGHELNTKMSAEMASAAAKLVRERVKSAEQAVKARDASWSDDPGDRTSRGKTVGGGLGICLGIASKMTGDGTLTAEERTECVLDLHGLHSNEANEVLEEFLLALEKEQFLGLAFMIVGEEKHTGTQDVARGASRSRLATGVGISLE
ncbi:hypothetical protein AMATHDRAFT_88609 [Amanita thiersii Skay4041]|uniref:C3H1-type domain-containing protein n=1 Tax=Amanita thiersii Skay4041 TaxID=703135 RepID=A0A2A9NCC6_9AGAR|nr:hypothetical protein AMATHDRAFT_88609 [Amanita thiersii Skay4041]